MGDFHAAKKSHYVPLFVPLILSKKEVGLVLLMSGPIQSHVEVNLESRELYILNVMELIASYQQWPI
jgi:hypothetical protein